MKRLHTIQEEYLLETSFDIDDASVMACSNVDLSIDANYRYDSEAFYAVYESLTTSIETFPVRDFILMISDLLDSMYDIIHYEVWIGELGYTVTNKDNETI